MLRTFFNRCSNFNSHFPSLPLRLSTLTNPTNQPDKKLDTLYRKIIVEVRGHDQAVLNSYEWFTKTAAKELGVQIVKIFEPKVHHEMRTLLRSAFIYKKHRVQYDFRTYFRIFEFKHLTGSTADTYLEYIQRNLPEGVSMKVTKHRVEKLPEHILNYVPEKKSESLQDAK